jgi:hypothetical protein
MTGCGRQQTVKPFDVTKARDVSLEDLELEARALSYFLFWGRENGFHYFGRPDGAVYRLPESVMTMPHDRGWKVGTAALYVTLRNGKFNNSTQKR